MAEYSCSLSSARRKVFLYPFRFFGWSNNLINIQQKNRKKTNLITYVWRPHKDNEDVTVKR